MTKITLEGSISFILGIEKKSVSLHFYIIPFYGIWDDLISFDLYPFFDLNRLEFLTNPSLHGK